MLAGILNFALHGINSAFTFNLVFNNVVNSVPRFVSRLIIVNSLAPSSANSTAIARAAPPAPKMAIFLPLGEATCLKACKKPLPSVFSPINFPSRFTTQFTAPII